MVLTGCIQISTNKSLNFGFNEWIKAQDGKPSGQDWQTWSAALYLYAAKCVENKTTPFFDDIRENGAGDHRGAGEDDRLAGGGGGVVDRFVEIADLVVRVDHAAEVIDAVVDADAGAGRGDRQRVHVQIDVHQHHHRLGGELRQHDRNHQNRRRQPRAVGQVETEVDDDEDQAEVEPVGVLHRFVDRRQDAEQAAGVAELRRRLDLAKLLRPVDRVRDDVVRVLAEERDDRAVAAAGIHEPVEVPAAGDGEHVESWPSSFRFLGNDPPLRIAVALQARQLLDDVDDGDRRAGAARRRLHVVGELLHRAARASSLTPSGFIVSAMTMSWLAPRNFSFSLSEGDVVRMVGKRSAAPGVMSPTLSVQPQIGRRRTSPTVSATTAQRR